MFDMLSSASRRRMQITQMLTANESREVSFTSANCIDILQTTHHLMSDKITVVPDDEMWLPQKLSKRLPPLVGSTDSSICIFFVINF